MNSSKHQSVTTDTRLTQSNLLSVSHLDKSGNFLAQNIQKAEGRETEFLKTKNAQLQERVDRMAKQIRDYEQNKRTLLTLNEKYVRVVNQYYRKGQSRSKSREIFNRRENQQKSKADSEQQVLQALEKDHRNLVKHCLVMQEQIKNYAEEMKHFQEIKDQLLTVNHTNAKQLIEELRASVQENRQLKKENNKISYELERCRLECKKLKKGKEETHGKATEAGDQVEKLRSLLSTVQQESRDRANEYEAKIYELELKTERLEKQLRRDQDWVNKNTDLRRRLQIVQVQQTQQKLRNQADFTGLLNPQRLRASCSKVSSKGRIKQQGNRTNGAISFYES